MNAPNQPPPMTPPNGQRPVTNGRPQPAQQPSRMTLSAITRGKVAAPLRVLCYGVEGVGKSTLGADAPDPVFLGTEDGTAHLDVARLPQPRNWQEVLDAVTLLTREPHDFKTLVIDSLDWLEPLVQAHVCTIAKVNSVEDIGYGKGHVASLEHWRKLIAALDKLRADRRMHVVLIGHALVKPCKNPEGPDYDRYTLKLHDKAASLFREWVDELLFARFSTFGFKAKGEMRAKGTGNGNRIVQTVHAAAYDAKTRHGLRDGMPLSWEEIERGCVDGDLEALDAARADALAAAQLPPAEAREKADAWMREVWGDRARLAQRTNLLRAKYPPAEEPADSTSNSNT